MPQEFHVLRCFSCEIFQVHQTKKDRKWICKVCGEKQSLKKAYFRGPARDCRNVVQKLNLEDGEKKLREKSCQSEELEENEVEDSFNFETEDSNNQENSETFDCYHPLKKQRKNEYPTDSPIEKGTYDTAHLTKPQAFPELGYTASSGIGFDLGFNDYVSPSFECKNSAEKIQEHNNKDDLPEKPKVTKNRGFQMILKAAQNLS